MFCHNVFLTLSAAHNHSCVMWLWWFLKSEVPHCLFMADAEALTPSGHLVTHISGFYRSMNVNRGNAISAMLTVYLFFGILHINTLYRIATPCDIPFMRKGRTRQRYAEIYSYP